MTEDEIITRLYRCEASQTALGALVQCLLPAIDPARRPVVLRQFQQFCQGWERKLDESDADRAHVELQLKALATLYTQTEGTIQYLSHREAEIAKAKN